MFRKFLATLTLAIASVAQVTTGDIVGSVADSSGAVLPGVRITVRNLATEALRVAVSDAAGNFAVTLLPPGRYSTRAEHPGFKAATLTEVTLAAGDRLRNDFILEVGQVDQSIEVEARAPALQTDSSTIGSLVTAKAVQDLPLNGRNFIKLAQITAGANESVQNALSSGNRPDDRRRTSSVSVNGQRDFVNNFLVDGMDNNERAIGTLIVRPSMDALAEFRVQTNLYSAEVGRTAGGVINLITRSGTNELHGSLYEFFRNSALDARNYFAPAGPKPPYRQNQFGGSLGGPLRRNRTFFFGDYEGLRIRQGEVFVSTVPTAAMKVGNFSGVNPIFDPLSSRPDPTNPAVTIRDRFPNDTIPTSRIDAPTSRIAQLYPDPNLPGLANNFVFAPVRRQRDDTFDARIDHRFSDHASLFGRYSFNDTNTFTTPQLPAVGDIEAGADVGRFAGTALQRAQGLLLNYTHVFTPTLLMELRAGYVRYAIQSLPLNYGKNVSEQLGIPGANVDEQSSGLTPFVIAGFRGLGDSNFVPLIDKNNLFQYAGSVTVIRGPHTIKVGADLKRRQITFYQSNQPRGSYNFDSNFTNDPSGATARSGNSMASLLLGYPASTTRANYLVWPGLRTWEVGAFVQDDWRVHRRLTLNLGLRYDVFTPFTEVSNRIANPDLAAGRILIAGQDGVSATAGVETDRNNFAPRFGFAYTATGRTVVRGGYGISIYPSNFGAQALFRTPPFVSLYSVVTTPLEVQNRVSEGFPLPTPTDPARPTGNLSAMDLNYRNSYVQQYNLTLQQDLGRGYVVSAGYVGALGRKQVADTNVNLALPGPGAVNPRRPFFGAFPNVQNITLQTTDTISNYHALQAQLERRYANGLSLSSNYTWGRVIDDTQAVAGGKPGSGPYPQLPNNRRLERGNSDIDIRHRFALLANYELPFFRRQNGAAGIILGGWQVNGVWVMSTGAPVTVANGAARANTGGGDRPNRLADGRLSGDLSSPQRWFDTTAFAAQPLFSVGTAGRNILTGPPLRQIDFSLFKDFPLHETIRLQFRAEFFNILNRPNLGLPNTALGTAPFGTISDTGNYGPRQIQFALKLLF
jgi:outer membrane receptor protein involved in Fe transport